MKQVLSIIIVSLFCATLTFAEENSQSTTSATTRVETFLKENYQNKHFDKKKLKSLVADVDSYNRMVLYFQYSISPDVVMQETLLNMIPSLGSFVVGDYQLAIMTDLFLIAGGVVTGMGFFSYGNSDAIVATGINMVITTWAMNIFSPALKATEFNQKLRKVLKIDRQLELIKTGELSASKMSSFNVSIPLGKVRF